MYKYCILILPLLWYFCMVYTTAADEIKTIDGEVIEGKVIDVDEEYLSVRRQGNEVCFIQWRIINLISRTNEVIIVNHDGKQKKFTVLKTANSLSAKDITITVTDEISSIYSLEKRAPLPYYTNEAEQPISESAQLNAENHSGSKDTSQAVADSRQKRTWSGYVDAGLTIQKGNSDALTANVKTGFLLERPRDSFYFNSLLLSGTNFGVKNTDKQLGTFRYTSKLKEKLYFFFQEGMEHDEVEELDLRSITSAGIGYKIFDEKTLKYKSEIGPSFTYERFRHDAIRTVPGLKLGNYLDWEVFTTTTVYAKVDFLPSMEDLIKWRLESDIGLRHKLNEHLSWNISWVNQYDSDPEIPGVKNNDATILSTIGYNF